MAISTAFPNVLLAYTAVLCMGCHFIYNNGGRARFHSLCMQWNSSARWQLLRNACFSRPRRHGRHCCKWNAWNSRGIPARVMTVSCKVVFTWCICVPWPYAKKMTLKLARSIVDAGQCLIDEVFFRCVFMFNYTVVHCWWQQHLQGRSWLLPQKSGYESHCCHHHCNDARLGEQCFLHFGSVTYSLSGRWIASYQTPANTVFLSLSCVRLF